MSICSFINICKKAQRNTISAKERQSQEAVRRVHQSSEWGALAAGSLECGVERNLYCPIVPLFPRSHPMQARPVHLQPVRASFNQPHVQPLGSPDYVIMMTGCRARGLNKGHRGTGIYTMDWSPANHRAQILMTNSHSQMWTI
ncbi:uncharacterized protein LOC144000438 [Festucalex cinctus]